MENEILSRETRRSYRELLKSREWFEYSRDLIEQAGQCWSCGSEDELIVHHLVYRNGVLPWQYAPDEVRVLCSECHTIVHTVADLIWVETLRFEAHELEIILKRLKALSDFRKIQRIGDTEQYSGAASFMASEIQALDRVPWRQHEAQQPE